MKTVADIKVQWIWHDPPPYHLKGFRRAVVISWMEAFGDICECCGRRMQYGRRLRNRNLKTYASIDHIIPPSKGGTNDLSNLRVICRQCNTRKGDTVQ